MKTLGIAALALIAGAFAFANKEKIAGAARDLKARAAPAA